jgi:hypothetical protein
MISICGRGSLWPLLSDARGCVLNVKKFQRLLLKEKGWCDVKMGGVQQQWGERPELNRRPLGPQPNALTN